MNMSEARGLAAQAWCDEKNSGKVLDTDLAESFAKILHDQMNPKHTCESLAERLQRNPGLYQATEDGRIISIEKAVKSYIEQVDRESKEIFGHSSHE